MLPYKLMAACPIGEECLAFIFVSGAGKEKELEGRTGRAYKELKPSASVPELMTGNKS